MTAANDQLRAALARGPKRHKYDARAVVVDGHRFPSMKEAKRYGELKLLQQAGHIVRLDLQPRYRLCWPDGTYLWEARWDFGYFECATRKYVVEDVKGFRTVQFERNAKIFRLTHPHIELRII